MDRLMTLASLAIAILVAACGGAKTYPDYRYRLTLEVETPQGLRSGSSVIEVSTHVASKRALLPNMLTTRARGEAVAVDLPGGQTVFALLRSEDNTDWATSVLFMMAPRLTTDEALRVQDPFDVNMQRVMATRGVLTLPHWFSLKPDKRSGYPMLVRFRDIRDPKTVELVDPDNLVASLGVGVKLKRIIVQMTDVPVTVGIGKRLPWLGDYPEPRLDSKYRGSTSPNLSQSLSHGDFRKGPSG